MVGYPPGISIEPAKPRLVLDTRDEVARYLYQHFGSPEDHIDHWDMAHRSQKRKWMKMANEILVVIEQCADPR